jgi:outer membrane lipoprotein carrier protein
MSPPIPGRQARRLGAAPGLLTTVALVCALAVVSAPASTEASLEQVLSRFDGVQGSIRTLSAEFTWTTRSELLKEPLVSRGRLYLTKPDAIRWEFTSPEEMSFVIAHDEYIGYFPARKTAERRDFKRWSEKLFRYFGVGQGSDELSQVYDIRLGDSGSADTDLLVLEPRKRRARKRIETLEIYVDRASGLPVRLVSSGTDGGSREILLHDVRVNPDLAAGLYDVEFPSDVTVTHGAAGLGGALQLAPGPSSR